MRVLVHGAQLLAGVSIGVLALSASAQSGGDAVTFGNVSKALTADAQSHVVTCASIASSFRTSAMENPMEAVDYFLDDKVKARWNGKIASEMSVQQLTDFFTAASTLSGPADRRAGMVGLYNPWWDAILLLNITSNATADFDNAPLKISDYVFLSGETFRGEKADGVTRCVTVVPESDPLSVELWRVTSGTRKKFMEMFPVEGQGGRSWSKLAKLRLELSEGEGKEMERIQTRSALRLQHSLALLKNARDTGLASFITRLARKGNLYRLYKHFREPNSRVLLKPFSELPEITRKGFTPYCYVPTERATLYVLVNKDMPTLYVTVTLMKDIKAETSSFEWYYLTQADELLAAWNNRKEVAK